jgi:hypothetical protein
MLVVEMDIAGLVGKAAPGKTLRMRHATLGLAPAPLTLFSRMSHDHHKKGHSSALNNMMLKL